VRHDRGVQAQIIWGANLIPGRGPRAAVTIRAADRHVRACRPKVCEIEGSDGGALATPGGGVGSCGVDVRPPSDSRIPKQKARGGFLRAGFAIFAMMALCR